MTISKQTSKGKKRQRKIDSALQVIKVIEMFLHCQFTCFLNCETFRKKAKKVLNQLQTLQSCILLMILKVRIEKSNVDKKFPLTVNLCFVDFAEKLHKKMESSREKFNVRLLLMNLISRLIGVHQVSTTKCFTH